MQIYIINNINETESALADSMYKVHGKTIMIIYNIYN